MDDAGQPRKRRRFRLTLELDGDDRPALAQSLQAISYQIRCLFLGKQDYEGFDASYRLDVQDDKNPAGNG